MSTKGILLAVADPQAVVDINQALGSGWESTSVASETDALAQLQTHTFDALLVDFNLGSPDASDLLNQVFQQRPEICRFLLAYEADLALVAAKVEGPHQILPKPIEPASLKTRLENGVAPETSDAAQTGTDTATDELPKVPAIYSQVLNAIESPGSTSQQVARLVTQDEALKSELLRLANSTYFGAPRNFKDTRKAVEALGLDAVKVLVMALRFLAEHSHLKPGYVSFDQIWQHSLIVGQIARDLVLFETKDRTLASQALAAGLVHDLGKVVLVTNFDDLYGRVHSLARKQPVPLWDIEKEMFGANHGEIGGCLVGMWNLPGPIVEAAALHHEPPTGEQQELTPLAAVHIANVLAHELEPGDECRVAPIMHTPFLNELGLLQRLPVWRAALANRRTRSQALKAKPAEKTESVAFAGIPSSRTGNLLPGPDAQTRTATSGQSPVFLNHQRRWVYAAAAVLLLVLGVLWRGTQPQIEKSEPIYARTSGAGPAPVAAAAAPETVAAQVPEATVTPTPEVAPSPAVSEQTTSAAAALPAPAPFAVASLEPAPSPVVQPPVTNAPPLLVAPKPAAAPVFRLSGIFYTVGRPSAIVNGEMVYVGDHVKGATVTRIDRASVTLQVDGQPKTYALH